MCKICSGFWLITVPIACNIILRKQPRFWHILVHTLFSYTPNILLIGIHTFYIEQVSFCSTTRRGWPFFGASCHCTISNLFSRRIGAIYGMLSRRAGLSASAGLFCYPRDAMLARIVARATCLSVCLTHAGIVSKRRKKASVMIFSPSGSPTILVFWSQISSWHSKGFPELGPQTMVGWENSAIFLALSINISKTVADRPKLLLMTNRKSHMSFRLTPRSMTLDDLELI